MDELHLEQQRGAQRRQILVQHRQGLVATAAIHLDFAETKHPQQVRHVISLTAEWLHRRRQLLANLNRVFALGQRREHVVTGEQLAAQNAIAPLGGFLEQRRAPRRGLTQPAELAKRPHGKARAPVNLPPHIDAAFAKQRLRFRAIAQRLEPFAAQVVRRAAHEPRVRQQMRVVDLHGQPLAAIEQPLDATLRARAGGGLEGRFEAKRHGHARGVAAPYRQAAGAGLELGATNRLDHAEPAADQQAHFKSLIACRAVSRRRSPADPARGPATAAAARPARRSHGRRAWASAGRRLSPGPPSPGSPSPRVRD